MKNGTENGKVVLNHINLIGGAYNNTLSCGKLDGNISISSHISSCYALPKQYPGNGPEVAEYEMSYALSQSLPRKFIW